MDKRNKKLLSNVFEGDQFSFSREARDEGNQVFPSRMVDHVYKHYGGKMQRENLYGNSQDDRKILAFDYAG